MISSLQKNSTAPEVQQIIQLIDHHDKIALYNHINPDGDSLSSSYGLLLAIKGKYPKKSVIWVTDIENIRKNWGHVDIDYSFLRETSDSSYQLAIIGDVAVKHRIEKFEEMSKSKDIICFDHHENDKDIATAVYWHEPHWPASAMQAIDIANALELKYTEKIAFALLIGLLTDTSNFSFSLNNPKPVFQYAELLQHVTRETMDNWFNISKRRTQEDIRSLQFMLKKLKYDGKVAYVYVTHKNINRYGLANAKNKIHAIGNIEGTSIWMIALEKFSPTLNRKIIDVHLRSNGPEVSKVALAHGGGGHKRACGCKVADKKELKQLLQELNELR